MGEQYDHFTLEERCTMARLRQAGQSIRQIAAVARRRVAVGRVGTAEREPVRLLRNTLIFPTWSRGNRPEHPTIAKSAAITPPNGELPLASVAG
jgi:hypothetical protein